MVEDTHSIHTSRLAEHWRWRPDWRRDRACLWWYLTFEDAPAVRTLARGVQDLLGRAPQLDLIPSPWLHLTLLEVGFADEVPPATVDSVVDTTRRALEEFPSFDLVLGPVLSLPGAVVLQAHADALVPLHERLTDAVLAARGADAVGALRAFVPHVSVAYVNRDCDPHEVMGPLDGADPPSASPSVTVTRVRLAAVTRERRHYQWTTRAVVPLAKSRFRRWCQPPAVRGRADAGRGARLARTPHVERRGLGPPRAGPGQEGHHGQRRAPCPERGEHRGPHRREAEGRAGRPGPAHRRAHRHGLRLRGRDGPVAAAAGARVVRQDEVLTPLVDRPGKGEALWKSLYVTHGDVVVFIDADLGSSTPSSR